MCQVLSGFSFFVLEQRIGAFVEEHFHELLVAETGGIVERSDVIEACCVDVRAVLDEELCEVVVTVICRLVKRCPAYKNIKLSVRHLLQRFP